MQRKKLNFVLQDYGANPEPKIRLFLMLFRASQMLRANSSIGGRIAGGAVTVIYRLMGDLIGIELPVSTRVGPALRISHGFGLVVNPASVIGRDVRLRHGVTLGNKRSAIDCPILGNGVNVGAGAAVLGSVVIGDNTQIGAGAVVLEDVAPDSIAVGNPARVLAKPNRRAAE